MQPRRTRRCSRPGPRSSFLGLQRGWARPRLLVLFVRPHKQHRPQPKDRTMTKYLISFPGRAMEVPAEDFAAVGEAAHEVMREAKAAGVYVFGGGINEDVAPLMVASDGTVTNE